MSLAETSAPKPQMADPETVVRHPPGPDDFLSPAELKALTPNTLSDENAHETGELAASPDLKTQPNQSTIHYRARFELRGSRFRNLPDGFSLRPGMRVVADVKVGRRAILDYVLNPITRVIDESLREP